MSSTEVIDAATSAKVLAILARDTELHDPRHRPFIPPRLDRSETLWSDASTAYSGPSRTDGLPRRASLPTECRLSETQPPIAPTSRPPRRPRAPFGHPPAG